MKNYKVSVKVCGVTELLVSGETEDDVKRILENSSESFTISHDSFKSFSSDYIHIFENEIQEVKSS